MTDPELEKLVADYEVATDELETLQRRRVHDILVVASLYDAYTLSEGQHLSELITGAYENLDLSGPPALTRVSTRRQALDLLAEKPFDLVITMAQPGDVPPSAFARAAKERRPGLPVYMVAYNVQELRALGDGPAGIPHIDRHFVWRGDASLFLAMIKLAEDRLNVEHDTRVGGVRTMILVEDSVPFYSAYLPVLFAEIVKQTESLISEEVSFSQRLMRRRLRPKLLLATSFEEAWSLYDELHETVLCVMSDLHFPRGGVEDAGAGVALLRRIREHDETVPLVLQSSDADAASAAASLSARYLDKRSPTLLNELRAFLLSDLGFGDFVFRMPDGTEVTRASDVQGMLRVLETMPAEGLVFHGSRNHFSNWLMARTEFRLATALRTMRVSDFETAEDLRTCLTQTMASIQADRRRGQIEDFDPQRFDDRTEFARIGGGSLGGKGRGLAFVRQLLAGLDVQRYIGDRVRLVAPRSVVIGTEVFDRFVADNDLAKFALRETDDRRILDRFQAAPLPADIDDALRAYLTCAHYPLAVRSSSLLEDSPYLPAAGVYPTHMLPNADPDIDVRLAELAGAVKHVYAATYFQAAKTYLASAPGRTEDEKMAVVLQELIGRRHDGHVYPVVSGVATSHNFYPVREMRADEGVASVALGLGRTVAEGGRAVRFSPAHPRWLPDLSLTHDILENGQREFWALDLSRKPDFTEVETGGNLVSLGLDVAERDCILWPVASVYSPDDDAVHDGLARAGVRLVTFAPILKHGVIPLADVLQRLLAIGSLSLSGPVEIEFAADVVPASRGPSDLAILQIRRLVVPSAASPAAWRGVRDEDVFVRASHALGVDRGTDLRDVVAVRPEAFDRAHTVEIAAHIGRMNAALAAEGRPYLLIGPGRWGTADPWLGIPVRWSDISSACLFVECEMEDLAVDPSQGSHFFHNITSLGLGYFTVDRRQGGRVDWAWLESRPPDEETEWVRRYRLDRPLEVLIDGRNGTGVVLKPDRARDGG